MQQFALNAQLANISKFHVTEQTDFPPYAFRKTILSNIILSLYGSLLQRTVPKSSYSDGFQFSKLSKLYSPICFFTFFKTKQKQSVDDEGKSLLISTEKRSIKQQLLILIFVLAFTAVTKLRHHFTSKEKS
ncbi:hypothetical protein ACH3XW_15195 [Acanthocheilonema viteae]